MIKFSWEDIEKLTDDLAEKIKSSGFTPDYIIGVTNGGLIPLYYMAKKLDSENILTISANSYDKENKGDLNITYLPEVDLANKKILLIDEIVESGDTLNTISKLAQEKYNTQEIRTAVLVVNKEKCKHYPDYFVLEEEGGWVVFPWEKHEFPEYFKESDI